MKKLMFLFAAALMMVACSNEEVATNDDVQYITELKLNFGKGDSRVASTHSSAGLKFSWEEGDQISVFQNKIGYPYESIYLYDKESESFKLSSNRGMEPGTEYLAAMNPGGEGDYFYMGGEGTANVEVNMILRGSLKKLPLISDVFTADASGTIATMHHLVGMVEIPVKLDASATITEVIKFSLFQRNEEDVNFSGPFKAQPMYPYVKKIYAQNSYGSTENGGPYTLSKDTATSIFIPLLPGNHNGVYLNYYYSSNAWGRIDLQNITVERGKITKVAEITINPS